MPYAELSGDRIWLFSEFREKELVQSVPGTRWDAEHGKWWIPLSWAACVQLRGTFGAGLQVGEQLNTWAAAEQVNRIGPCVALRDQEDAELEYNPPSVSGFELFPRQRAGVKFLVTARRAAMCDGMGSGKTAQTIRALENMSDAYPALIVCTNTMKRTWAAEFAEWAPHRRVVIIEGGAAKRRKLLAEDADVFVINWEALRSHTRLAGYGPIKLTDKEKEFKELNELPLRTVVADEAHRAKNPRAKQTRALWAVGWAAENRYALTGTPVGNTPEDTWAIMHFVEPREWQSKVKFIERYALQSWSNFGFMEVVGIRTEMKDELFRVLDPRFIRRPSKLMMQGVPDKLPPQIRRVELPPKQRRAYDQLRKELLAELDSGVLMASNPLTRMTRLLQLAAAYGEIDGEGNLVLAEPSSKLDALDDVLEELGADEPAVVFAESRQLLDLAEARFTKRKWPVGKITGGVTPADREVYKQRFQAGEIRALLVTYGAGGEGLTLTASRFPIRLQPTTSLIKNRQAEDRTHRQGQTRAVQPIDIVSLDTYEERVYDQVEVKGERLEEIVRDQEQIRRWLEK
jgi:SNF2 family DNA or RNA helicase